MEKLVSVIIPCFNAQKWVAEAIDSCLKQTYPQIEIIVIDDGSTDNSLEIVKSYKDKVIWETGANRGGNYARNRGFTLSKGEYIQYLDADDYLLPEKIEKQVQALEATKTDVVYGDWRYKKHLPNGNSFLEDIKTCGPKTDFLESLLANDRWVPPVALLFTRDIISRSSGWDENFKAAQDRDFLLSLAIDGAKFTYQPICHSIYRSHGKVTVSTTSKLHWLRSHCLVMEKAEKKLAQSGRLSLNYRQALAKAYFEMGREYLYGDSSNPENSKCWHYLQVLKKSLSVYPEFQVTYRNIVYKLTQKYLGSSQSELLAYVVTKVKKKISPQASEKFVQVQNSV
ncbi:MAG: glycosyltransferase [Kastovskya adunca ATA6-11-RM4]|jgi:glycosyltransferase involved in cell wall biosynthesis|nr:glycosyltransferase [Kastovskya adunca ATA6-11-RM4]